MARTAKRDSFQEFVLEQLQGVREVSCRPMFGGHGLYTDRHFFGIIFRGRLYFKVSDASQGDYTAAGMKPFTPSATMMLKSFYEVPADVLEDRDEIVEWATVAVRAANQRAAKRASVKAGNLKRRIV